MLGQSLASVAARLACAVFTILALSAAAEAQYITYVAANGNDANPCTVVTAPCKTLQRAVNVTTANGTVRVLTPVQSSVFINKSITIAGDGVAVVGQITIGGATAVVRVRGLLLDGVGGFANGIRIDNAAAVHIEDCTIERYSNDAIKLVTTAATRLFISDTIATTSVDGLYADAVNAQVVIENSHFDRNGSSGVYLRVAKASVTRSSASGNPQYGFILTGVTAKITETAADNNVLDGFWVRAGSHVFLNAAEAHGNGSNGLELEGTVPTPEASINACVFASNGGPDVVNGGILFTRNNNSVPTFSGNGTAVFNSY